MPPAIIGGAIAAVGAVGSAAIGASAANKAAKASAKAADASAQVQRDIYGENKGILSPWTTQGLGATNHINALLGLPQAQVPATDADYGNYARSYPDIVAGYNSLSPKERQQFPSLADYGRFHWETFGQGESRQLPNQNVGQVSQADANQAFDTFRNSTGYQFRLGQGLDAINSGYAGAGTLKSGAAMKGITDYGQGMASQEFGNYLNSLGNQQGVGLSAGSALAGVGQNYANSLGNIYMQNGENQANAALIKGQNIGQAFNSLATIGSGIFGRKG